MLGDAAASVGVVIAGIIILFTGSYIADPIVSIIFALLVLWSSWGILHESVQILLEATPIGMDMAKVESEIREVKGVLNVYDLHVWTVSSGLIACTCHIEVAEQNVSDSQKIMHLVAEKLVHEYNISNSTIQVEVEYFGGHEHTEYQDHKQHHDHTTGHEHHHAH